MRKWIRTCQECGHKLWTKPPAEGKPITPAYEFKACPVCKSEAFDYGSYREEAETEE